MKEKINNLKQFIIDNAENCADIGIITGVAMIGFAIGRISAKQHLEAKCTWTDKDGLIVKEQFIGIIK